MKVTPKAHAASAAAPRTKTETPTLMPAMAPVESPPAAACAVEPSENEAATETAGQPPSLMRSHRTTKQHGIGAKHGTTLVTEVDTVKMMSSAGAL